MEAKEAYEVATTIAEHQHEAEVQAMIKEEIVDDHELERRAFEFKVKADRLILHAMHRGEYSATIVHTELAEPYAISEEAAQECQLNWDALNLAIDRLQAEGYKTEGVGMRGYEGSAPDTWTQETKIYWSMSEISNPKATFKQKLIALLERLPD
ncbi:MAG: hypothetical protein JWN33_531 [Candidatus Saccharibacteria bacterium]|nr:hypothetical protein [Candidatus Saccharibacteria bacterium]